MSDLTVTILMPCLNEAETLAHCVRQAVNALRDNNVAGEVLVADNGSTDGSQQIAQNEGARVVHATSRGYGAALMTGIQAAHGKYVLMADSDASYDFGHLPRFLAKLEGGDDLVMGNRFGGEIKPGAMPPLHRHFGNPALSFIGRLFFRVSVRDFHCGIRAIRRDAIRSLDIQTTGMEFASEIIVKSNLAGLRISEVPTTLSPDGRTRAPYLRTWRDGWRHLRFLLLFSPRWLFFYPWPHHLLHRPLHLALASAPPSNHRPLDLRCRHPHLRARHGSHRSPHLRLRRQRKGLRHARRLSSTQPKVRAHLQIQIRHPSRSACS